MPEPHNEGTKKIKNPWPQRIAIGAVVVLGLIASVYAYLFTTTPAALRVPQLEHAHVRFQLLVDGQAVNFGESKFQTHYAQACSDNISPEPIHFHDGKDQFMHLHWKGVSGGLVLKNYGMNMIGGADDTLGYRFDMSPLPTRVAIHGSNLPAKATNAQVWVYTGDAASHRERQLTDFLYQDIETFLGVKSSVSNQQSWLDRLFFARASAHNGEVHDTSTEAEAHDAREPASAISQSATNASAHDQAQLARLQNMLGNIVVFVQKDKPTDAQVTERFNQLAPIPESTCGG